MRAQSILLSCILSFTGVAMASLQSDVSSSSTMDLKKRDARLRDANRDWRVYAEFYGRRAVGTSIHDFDVSEVHAVDGELLRRYRSGDKAAWIPAFRTLGYRAPR